MRKLLLLSLLFASTLQAGEVFYREHDEDSVVLGPICVPDVAGVVVETTMDFDLVNLVITITPNTAVVGFNYTGGNIDNVAVTDTWDDPPANAIAVEKVTVGANNGCITLHLRDEVLAVAGASEWMIGITDAGSAIMSHSAQIIATLGSSDIQTATTAALEADGLDHLVAAAVIGADVTDNSIMARIAASGATADWDTFVNTDDSLQALQLDHIRTELALYNEIGLVVDSGTSTTIVDSALSGADGDYTGNLVRITGADDIPQVRMVIDYVASSDTLTVFPAFTDIPDIGRSYDLLHGPGAAILIDDAITAAKIAANAIGASELATDAVAEIVAAVWAETVAEPTVLPAWDTATVVEAVAYLMAWYRNEVQQTASVKTLRNDADDGDIITCAVSDNGTIFQVDECATAP